MKKLIQLLILLVPLSILGCKSDLCKDITCLNGGTCLNGLCSCPEGYEGPACEKEKTPKSILLQTVGVTKFPATKPNGASWDNLPASGADLYFIIKQNNVLISNSRQFAFTDAISNDIPKNLSFGSGIRIPNSTEPVLFELWDSDSFGSDELVDVVSYPLYIKGKNFPKQIEFTTFDTKWFAFVSYEF